MGAIFNTGKLTSCLNPKFHFRGNPFSCVRNGRVIVLVGVRLLPIQPPGSDYFIPSKYILAQRSRVSYRTQSYLSSPFPRLPHMYSFDDELLDIFEGSEGFLLHFLFEFQLGVGASIGNGHLLGINFRLYRLFHQYNYDNKFIIKSSNASHT